MNRFDQMKHLLALSVLSAMIVGCSSGSGQAVLPTGELTEEQKAAVKAEDLRVDEEESQGKMNKPKNNKKS
jgi:uncharacterized protein YcfL